MRTLKDSKNLGIATIGFVQGLDPSIHSDVKVVEIIMQAIKFGADWQLRTSEANYRRKHRALRDELYEAEEKHQQNFEKMIKDV